jgi:hypothetical protein
MTGTRLRRVRSIFAPTSRYEGVRPINIYLLRVLFGLMATVLGADVWTHIVTFEGAWEPVTAAAWCMWAGFSVLAVLGVINPLKMLPLVMLEIFYKVLWLMVVAYPLWSRDELVGSSVEELTYAFSWVVLAIVAMPWGYAFRVYAAQLRRPAGMSHTDSPTRAVALR